MPKFNPKQTLLTLNLATAGYKNISPSVPFCRRMEVVECPPGGGTFNGTNFNPVGFNYKKADDAFAQIYGNPPGQILPLGDEVAFGANQGRALGAVAYTDPSGTAVTLPIVLKLEGADAAVATTVCISEWV